MDHDGVLNVSKIAATQLAIVPVTAHCSLPSDPLLAAGGTSLFGRRSWNRRFITLQEGVLQYYKVSNIIQLQGTTLSQSTAELICSTPGLFSVNFDRLLAFSQHI